jgi:hypothetical protein
MLIDIQRIYRHAPTIWIAVFHVDFAEVNGSDRRAFDVGTGKPGGLISIITQPDQVYATNLSAGSDFINPRRRSVWQQQALGTGRFSYRISQPYVYGSGKSFRNYSNYRERTGQRAFAISTAWSRFSVSPRANHLVQITYSPAGRPYPLSISYVDAIYDDADQILRLPDRQTVRRLKATMINTASRHWMTVNSGPPR